MNFKWAVSTFSFCLFFSLFPLMNSSLPEDIDLSSPVEKREKRLTQRWLRSDRKRYSPLSLSGCCCCCFCCPRPIRGHKTVSSIGIVKKAKWKTDCLRSIVDQQNWAGKAGRKSVKIWPVPTYGSSSVVSCIDENWCRSCRFDAALLSQSSSPFEKEEERKKERKKEA